MEWVIGIYWLLAGVVSVAALCWMDDPSDRLFDQIVPVLFMLGGVFLPLFVLVWVFIIAPTYGIRRVVKSWRS